MTGALAIVTAAVSATLPLELLAITLYVPGVDPAWYNPVVSTTPPVELQPAHELLAAAFQMARRAATGRRNAVSSGNMTLAWEASSAAAGALMLLERAAQELDRLTTPPSNR